MKITDLSEDVVTRIFGYLNFTDRERLSCLSAFQSATSNWYLLEKEFPNQFADQDKIDRKISIKNILLKYPRLQSVDCTKIRTNSLDEIRILISFWIKNDNLKHFKPNHTFNWIRVLRDYLQDLFISCHDLQSLDLTINPPSCFHESFLRDVINYDNLHYLRTNYLAGFRLNAMVNLKSLILDSITDNELKKIVNNSKNLSRIHLVKQTPKDEFFDQITKLDKLNYLHIRTLDKLSGFQSYLDQRGNQIRTLKIDFLKPQIHILDLVITNCQNLKTWTIGE